MRSLGSWPNERISSETKVKRCCSSVSQNQSELVRAKSRKPHLAVAQRVRRLGQFCGLLFELSRPGGKRLEQDGKADGRTEGGDADQHRLAPPIGERSVFRYRHGYHERVVVSGCTE